MTVELQRRGFFACTRRFLAKFYMARTDNQGMVHFPVGVGVICVICLLTVAVPVKGRNMMRCSNCMRSIYLLSTLFIIVYVYIVCQK